MKNDVITINNEQLREAPGADNVMGRRNFLEACLATLAAPALPAVIGGCGRDKILSVNNPEEFDHELERAIDESYETFSLCARKLGATFEERAKVFREKRDILEPLISKRLSDKLSLSEPEDHYLQPSRLERLRGLAECVADICEHHTIPGMHSQVNHTRNMVIIASEHHVDCAWDHLDAFVHAISDVVLQLSPEEQQLFKKIKQEMAKEQVESS